MYCQYDNNNNCGVGAMHRQCNVVSVRCDVSVMWHVCDYGVTALCHQCIVVSVQCGVSVICCQCTVVSVQCGVCVL